MKRLLLAFLLLAAPAAAQQETIYVDRLMAAVRLCVGCTTFGATSPLQVVGLPTLAGNLVTVDGSGNLGIGGAATAPSTLGVTGAFSANGTVTLGDASGDTINFSGRVNTTILWTTDNLVDIGASGANRPRDLFLGRNAAIGGTLGVTGNTTLTGDLAINGNDLTSTGVLTVRPTGNLTLDPTGDVIIGADGLDVLPATGYAYNLGALTNKYLTLHAAELWVQTLVAQETIATIGGRVLVVPTTVLSADLASGGTTITVKHNQIASGDRIYLEAGGQVEFMAITSGAGGSAGAYTYSVTRNLDGSGANNWTAGDAVANLGTTGDGFIDLYSTRGVKAGTEYGPTIVGNVRNSSTYNDWSPRWAAGNLNGLYGYATDRYGFAAGNPSDTYFTIDATDGFQMYDGAVKKFWLTTSGAMALYDSATTYLQLNGGAIKMVENSVELFSLASGVATFGRPLTSNDTGQIRIDSDSVDIWWRNSSGVSSRVFYVQGDGAGGAVGAMDGTFMATIIDTATVRSASTHLTLSATSIGSDVIVQPGAFGEFRPYADNTYDFGTSSYAWSEIFADITTTTTDYNPIVLGASGQFLEKTDGVSATFNPTTCTSMTFHSGLLVAKAGC